MGGISRQPPVILIDAGHGGKQRGAVSGGLEEAIVALDIAIRLRDMLDGMRCHTAMTRTGDDDVSHRTRCAMATAADMVVSCHVHADTSISKCESEVWSREQDRAATEFARLVKAELTDRFGMQSEWRHTHRTQILNGPKPGIVVVGGYLSNPATAAAIAGGDFQHNVASAIFSALANKFGL